MSKPAVIRHEQVVEMISEIHESMTNVVTSGAYTVASIIMDSIHEDAIWVGTQSDVTFGEIERIVQMWIDDETAIEFDDTPPSAKEIAWERLCRLRDISDALHVRIVALDIRTDDYFDKVIHLGNRALRISQEGARIEREYGFTIR
jgi:hypothetical protein